MYTWLNLVSCTCANTCGNSVVFMFTSVLSWLLLSINTNVNQLSNHSLFYKVCMMSVWENSSLYLACVMNQNLWFISLIEFGIALYCWQDLLKFTWWFYEIQDCMCKTMTDIWIRSARVQHFQTQWNLSLHIRTQ